MAGVLRDCRLLKELPGLDRSTMSALKERRYSSATWNDQPLEVDYTFDVWFDFHF